MTIKKLLLFLSILGLCNINLFALLKDDKEDLMQRLNYTYENTEDPILKDLYDRALQCCKMNDFKNSAFFYKKVLDIKKSYKETVFLLEAVEKMMKYPTKEAKETVVNEYFNIGKEYFDTKHYLAALNIWEKLVIFETENAETIKGYVIEARRLLAEPYYQRGWDAYKRKDFEKAIEEWEHVLALVPNYQGLDALVEKAKAKNIEVKLKELISLARRNYDTDNQLIAYDYIIKALKLDQKNEDALELNKMILNKISEKFSRLYNAGSDNLSSREYRKALDNFNKALEFALDSKNQKKCKDAITKTNLEISRSKQTKPVEAVEVETPKLVETQQVQIALKKSPNQEEVRKHYNQGLYYYRNGYITKAITEWETVLALDPEHERAYTSLQRAKALEKK